MLLCTQLLFTALLCLQSHVFMYCVGVISNITVILCYSNNKYLQRSICCLLYWVLYFLLPYNVESHSSWGWQCLWNFSTTGSVEGRVSETFWCFKHLQGWELPCQVFMHMNELTWASSSWNWAASAFPLGSDSSVLSLPLWPCTELAPVCTGDLLQGIPNLGQHSRCISPGLSREHGSALFNLLAMLCLVQHRKLLSFFATRMHWWLFFFSCSRLFLNSCVIAIPVFLNISSASPPNNTTSNVHFSVMYWVLLQSKWVCCFQKSPWIHFFLSLLSSYLCSLKLYCYPAITFPCKLSFIFHLKKFPWFIMHI